MHLRSRELLGGRFHRLAGMRDDLVGALQHVLRVEVDHLPQRIDLIEACDPLRKDVAVVLHLLSDRGFARRFAVDVVEHRGELILRRKEQLMRQLGLRQPVFGLLMPHGQKRQHQPLRIEFGQPIHVFIDDALDGVAAFAQFLLQTRILVDAPSAFCSRTSSLELSCSFNTCCRNELTVPLKRGSAALEMIFRLCSAVAYRPMKLLGSSSFGAAEKSFATIRMPLTVRLNSRLASAIAIACCGVRIAGGDAALGRQVAKSAAGKPDYRDEGK
jgi:hypothetical protein